MRSFEMAGSLRTNDVDDVREKQERLEKALNSWAAVAHGLNRVAAATYLLGNVLVFACFLYPLLYRIAAHSRKTGHVVDFV